MQLKLLPKRTALVVAILLGLTAFIALQRESVLYVENTAALLNSEQINVELPFSPADEVGKPVHIRIPSISVDAPFEYVGITPDGANGCSKRTGQCGLV